MNSLHHAGRRASLKTLMGLSMGMLLAGCITRSRIRSDMLTGKMAIQMDATEMQPSRSSSANFELEGNPQQGELRLSSFLGTLLADASWTPQNVQLKADGQVRNFPDLNAMSLEMLGEVVPVVALFNWLRGQPWPDAAHQNFESEGQTGFDQLGWRIQTQKIAQGIITATRLEGAKVVVRTRLDQPSSSSVR